MADEKSKDVVKRRIFVLLRLLYEQTDEEHQITSDELVEYLYYYAPGDDVEITYAIANRGEFEEETVTVTLGEQSKSDSAVLDDGEEDSDSDEETEEEPERSREEIMDDWGPGSFGDFGRFGGWN